MPKPTEIEAALAHRVGELEAERDRLREALDGLCDAIAKHLEGRIPVEFAMDDRVVAAFKVSSPTDAAGERGGVSGPESRGNE